MPQIKSQRKKCRYNIKFSIWLFYLNLSYDTISVKLCAAWENAFHRLGKVCEIFFFRKSVATRMNYFIYQGFYYMLLRLCDCVKTRTKCINFFFFKKTRKRKPFAAHTFYLSARTQSVYNSYYAQQCTERTQSSWVCFFFFE